MQVRVCCGVRGLNEAVEQKQDSRERGREREREVISWK